MFFILDHKNHSVFFATPCVSQGNVEQRQPGKILSQLLWKNLVVPNWKYMVVVVPQNILSSNCCSISASLCFEISISQRQGARWHVAEKSSWQFWQRRDAIWVVSRTLPQQVHDKLTQKPVKLIYEILRSKNSLEQTIRGRWGYCLNSRLIKSKTWGRRAKHLPTGIQSGPTSNSWWSQWNAWCSGRCGCPCGSELPMPWLWDFQIVLQTSMCFCKIV